MIENFKLAIANYISASQIIENELLRYAYSTDASPYRMIPKLVLIVKTKTEVVEIIKLANQHNIKLTFRAAGTSLSGQAVTDEVLVMLAANSWLNYQIINEGRQIKLEPSIIGSEANKYLKIFGRKIGPDPGSINTAKIGGIIANNSSGKCCGTAKNSYATIESIEVVFADSSVLDTSNQQSIDSFKANNNDFIDSIETLHKQIKTDNDLKEFIAKKFSIKNTSGYSLNAFLDFDDPIKIIERLLVGSEGTLGFVNSVTLHTLPDYKHKALNLIYGDLNILIELTVNIKNLEPSSVELLDYLSLKSVAGKKELEPYLVPLDDENIAAIMIELSEDSEESLNTKLIQVEDYMAKTKLVDEVGFRCNQNEIDTLWKTRNGVLPTIAGNRAEGTSVLIEDVAVDILKLPSLVKDLKVLFTEYNYNEAAIFGHVLAGNIHFVLTLNLADKEQVILYDEFMHKLADLVAVKYNGSLKAEHGSGRNISPFAIVEWGQKCWDMMWQIKNLFDPKNILNPDVKLTRDNTLHIKNLKKLRSVDDEIDKCMECGFCEPVCPSRNLTLTPRQRNTVARKINSLQGEEKQRWQKDFDYYGVETCATTSLCKTRCPVDIDTGAFILKQKNLHNKAVNHAKEIFIAKQKVKAGNIAGSIVGKSNLMKITKSIHSKFNSIPIYLDTMPKVQNTKFENTIENATNSKKVLLIPACPNKIFAGSYNSEKYPSQLILERLGFSVEYPKNLNNQCCGQMYHSKNNKTQEQIISNKLLEINYSKYDFVITDNSSCSNFAKDKDVEIIDINSLVLVNIDKLSIKKKYKNIALHIDCSTRKQNIDQKYIDTVEKCCDKVVTPERIYCCGFAGDKGLKTPELNASSLENLYTQIKDCEIGVSFNRSCQIGLSHHGRIEYISFVELLLECRVSV